MLYVYPLSLDFRSGKGRNIGVKVQFLSGEEKEDVCPAIYGKSCSPSFLREAWCPVVYHNRYAYMYLTVVGTNFEVMCYCSIMQDYFCACTSVFAMCLMS